MRDPVKDGVAVRVGVLVIETRVCVAVGVAVTEPVREVVADCEGVGGALGVCEGVTVPLLVRVDVCVDDGDAVPVRDGDGVTVLLPDNERVPLPEPVVLPLRDGVWVAAAVFVIVCVPLRDDDGVAVRELDGVPLREDDEVPDLVVVAEAVGNGVERGVQKTVGPIMRQAAAVSLRRSTS